MTPIAQNNNSETNDNDADESDMESGNENVNEDEREVGKRTNGSKKTWSGISFLLNAAS